MGKKFVDKTIEELRFTHVVTNKELQDLLKQYPDDALVAIECCNPTEMVYRKENNVIYID